MNPAQKLQSYFICHIRQAINLLDLSHDNFPALLQLVTLAPLSPGYTEPSVVLGCQDYTIRVVDRSVPIHQVSLSSPSLS